MTQHPASTVDTTPYWIESASLPRFPKLERDEHVDVLIVGGGITGLTAAYLLAVAGKSVAVIERDRCALVDTGHTSAHLTMVTDKRLVDLVKDFGRNHAAGDLGRRAWRRLPQIDAIVREEEIACDFDWVPGYLHSPRRRLTNRRHRRRFSRKPPSRPTLGSMPRFLPTVPGVERPRHSFRRSGAVSSPKVPRRPRTRASPRAVDASTSTAPPRNSATTRWSSDQGRNDHVRRHRGGDAYTAGGSPFHTAGAMLFQTKLALYTSYVVAGRVPRLAPLPDALFWDTADPYHYLRLETHRDYDLVIARREPITRPARPTTPRRATSNWSSASTRSSPGIEVTPPMVGPGDRDARRPPVHRARRRQHQFAATGFSRQRHDVRHPGRDDRVGSDPGADQSVDAAASTRHGRAFAAACGSTSRRTTTTPTT